METNKNLLIAMQVINDECIKHSKCEDCPVWEHLDDICEPHYDRAFFSAAVLSNMDTLMTSPVLFFPS